MYHVVYLYIHVFVFDRDDIGTFWYISSSLIFCWPICVLQESREVGGKLCPNQE